MRSSKSLVSVAPSRNWVVEGLLREGSVALLAGHPKHGKGYFAKQLAAAIASGESFLHRFEIPKRGKTLYMDVNQQDPHEFHRELTIALVSRESLIKEIVQPSDRHAEREGRFAVHYIKFPGEDAEEDLIEKITRVRPKLVGLDDFETIRKDPPIQGNAYRHDKEAMASIRRVAQTTGVAILVVLHLRKAHRESTPPTFQDISGSAALRGEADATFLLWDGGKCARPKTGSLQVELRGVAPFTLKLARHPQGHVKDGFWFIDPASGQPLEGSLRGTTEARPLSSKQFQGTRRTVAEALTKKPQSIEALMKKLGGMTESHLKKNLSQLKGRGFAINPSRGNWSKV